jgi:hypothetical protein
VTWFGRGKHRSDSHLPAPGIDPALMHRGAGHRLRHARQLPHNGAVVTLLALTGALSAKSIACAVPTRRKKRVGMTLRLSSAALLQAEGTREQADPAPRKRTIVGNVESLGVHTETRGNECIELLPGR